MNSSSSVPKLSIIITTFNRPQYLIHAIESVLSQDVNDYELIIVNDASPDTDTDRIVSSYKDARIRYYKNETNQGSSKSLNIGIKAAMGEYIAILDDDDEWISREKIREQIEFLDRNVDHVCVGTNVVVVDYESGKEITRSSIPYNDSELRKRFLKMNPIAHSSVVFRRKAALSVGCYDEALSRGKDYDLWLKLAKKGKIAVLPKHHLLYRESSFKQRNILHMRKEDSKAVMFLIWKYRKDYPGFFVSYLKSKFRYLIFNSLEFFRNIYGAKIITCV